MHYAVGRCNIRTLRKALGWSQKRLSEASGVGTRTLSHYETGRRKMMTINIAVPIADALDVHPRDLFELIPVKSEPLQRKR